MLTHKSHYSGIHNYITKEHDYSLYYTRPHDVEWHLFKDIPKIRSNAAKKERPQAAATRLLTTALPRPNYVMSEPWLFVPSVEENRPEVEKYQQALGFETVLRHLLNKTQHMRSHLVACAKCQVDFSSEWFTFMSQRLCKCCYKVEVKSRNSIIYMTNVTNIARKAHQKSQPRDK